MRSARIEVHIEELTLCGFPPINHEAVGQAVKRQLVHHIEMRDESDLASVAAKPIIGAWADLDARWLGPVIADAVYRRIFT